jgi:hypothetical protein
MAVVVSLASGGRTLQPCLRCRVYATLIGGRRQLHKFIISSFICSEDQLRVNIYTRRLLIISLDVEASR